MRLSNPKKRSIQPKKSAYILILALFSIGISSCNNFDSIDQDKFRLDNENSEIRKKKEKKSKVIKIEDKELRVCLIMALGLSNESELNIELAEDIESINLCHHKPIRSLKGLEYFKNLETLKIKIDSPLTKHEIEDLKPLEKLKNLDTLYLPNNNISNLRPLERLRNLSYLSLSGNSINDISSLSCLENLSVLSLSNNEIENIKALKNLKGLRQLSLYNNKIGNIEALKNLFLLEILLLKGNPISNVQSINHFDQIKFLDVKLKEERIEGWSQLIKDYYRNFREYFSTMPWGCLIEDVINDFQNFSPLGDSMLFRALHLFFYHYHFSGEQDHQCTNYKSKQSFTPIRKNQSPKQKTTDNKTTKVDWSTLYN